MKYDKNHSLLECDIPGVPKKEGKVRDVFDLGDSLLMVVTDRISAFDVILPCGVPDKGKVLNMLSLFWLEFLGVKNHLITADVEKYPEVLKPYAADLKDRSMLVQRQFYIHQIAGEGLEPSTNTVYEAVELPTALPRRKATYQGRREDILSSSRNPKELNNPPLVPSTSVLVLKHNKSQPTRL